MRLGKCIDILLWKVYIAMNTWKQCCENSGLAKIYVYWNLYDLFLCILNSEKKILQNFLLILCYTRLIYSEIFKFT